QAQTLIKQTICIDLNARAIDVAAGEPTNTDEAGANHRVACFAGSPAPTGDGVTVKIVLVAVPEN
ncbi:hypothetical protein ACOQNQ_21250, partial [Pseudomonas juntendi]|uniref:hypothetical protein n=1 Tax=Pseudomonas juntendi TaxID=2666183 RepID=UPI003B946DB5